MRSFSESFFINEHLWYGHLGHFLIVSAFVLALFSFITGIKSFLSSKQDAATEKLSKTFFKLHAVCVWIILGLLILMFKNQVFEYHYIWRHSSKELPWYYILSAIWEGQEGSFLLWIFWQSVLGMLFVRKNTSLSVGVLSILALVQAMLMTMILGVDVFGKLIGTNPFILLRDEMSIPILERANYLEFITDGNGLNILLQNYWMVIHPPVLFLGFASVTIPFAYAMSSLLKRDFTSWTQEVSPWALFSMSVLGTGILMGGKWAYEALSFGGFWAWDPVENASFVPWLFLTAGLHTLMIYKATKHSLKATFLLFIFAFAFVLYSTFLTRSGILGDSSVHSFTDLGMTGQLLIFLGIFLLPAFLLLAFYWSKIEDNQVDEKTSSREFWIFLGALFIVVSAIQITYSTSIPVWNKLFDLTLAPPVNANEHYNNIQIWFAIIVTLLMAITPFMNYRKTDVKLLMKELAGSFIASIIMTGIVFYFSQLPIVQQYKLGTQDTNFKVTFISAYFLVLLTSVTLVVLSVYYTFKKLKNASKLYWGGSIAHLGFGLLVLGALLSQYQKKAISFNMAGVNFGEGFNEEEQTSNVLLIKGKPEIMENYQVTYQGSIDTKTGAFYKLWFKHHNDASDTFSLYPEGKMIKEGPKTRLQAEPSIKHYLTKDIFTHVSSVPDKDEKDKKSKIHKAKIHDTIYVSNYKITFDRVKVIQMPTQNAIVELRAFLNIYQMDQLKDSMALDYKLNTEKGTIEHLSKVSKDGELTISLDKIVPENNEFEFNIEEKHPVNDWIILKTVVFPHINVLWLGCILIGLGSMMSAFYRRKKSISTI